MRLSSVVISPRDASPTDSDQSALPAAASGAACLSASSQTHRGHRSTPSSCLPPNQQTSKTCWQTAGQRAMHLIPIPSPVKGSAKYRQLGPSTMC